MPTIKPLRTTLNKPRRAPRTSGKGVSLARALSKLGIASRTQAAQLIADGAVSINGKTTTNPELRVDLASARISVHGQHHQAQPRRVLMLNKPRGLVTTRQDERGRATVYQCLPDDAQSLHAVGRLDMASEGLLLFTNDNQLANRLLSPETHVEKVYHVQISPPLDQERIQRLCQGVEIEPGQFTRPARVRELRRGEKTCWLEFSLTEGLNRQIRRMVQVVGGEVHRLIRVKIGALALAELAKGETRELTADEIQQLADASRPHRDGVRGT